MPLSGGTTGAHDDAAHQGNAKRDVVDGVAGLGPAGNVLAVGPDLELTRDGSENIEVVERTSGDIVFRWTRVGLNDFQCRVNCGGVACIIQNDSMKNVANGIAGLDGSTELSLALIKAALTGKKTDLNGVLNTGGYTGNDTANRAIAHGLGRKALLIMLIRTNATLGVTYIMETYIVNVISDSHNQYTLTVSDDTNFYVGNAASYSNSANGAGHTWIWVAIG